MVDVRYRDIVEVMRIMLGAHRLCTVVASYGSAGSGTLDFNEARVSGCNGIFLDPERYLIIKCRY